MLMRNMNIQQIKTFSKVNRKFVVNTEWDMNVVSTLYCTIDRSSYTYSLLPPLGLGQA